MKVTVLGSSGSLGAHGNPASGYLVEATAGSAVVMDLGPGVLGNLQTLQNPSEAHVVFSHLHPDHCLDFPSLMVWRRYHPERAAHSHHICAGPRLLPEKLGILSANEPGQIDDMGDTFTFTAWQAHHAEIIGGLHVTPYPAIHPSESYSLRVEDQATGAVIAYSGDTAYHEHLIAAADQADLFICEATWGESSDGKVTEMHMSGAEAGRAATQAGAKKLLLTHIPPWVDWEATRRAAAAHYHGPIELARPFLELEI
ncbi:MBL fold metallo-hydrolase [Corynebacterium sp. ES2730-CONJ]|uniref:MBL fold metallo-hydrolase n=1 Tax=Corynebacterium sp. ES2730-CONJ TaxID=2973941 RepID=UPI00216AB850|nr:MBL fold metallo-hydrolase [Corynebacterium sp. ES2730-CONJ]MCS4532581.1 MBL fold metallo-hydrolase [Corynebacterium sp. ES2730-CONJ]